MFAMHVGVCVLCVSVTLTHNRTSTRDTSDKHVWAKHGDGWGGVGLVGWVGGLGGFGGFGGFVGFVVFDGAIGAGLDRDRESFVSSTTVICSAPCLVRSLEDCTGVLGELLWVCVSVLL